MLVAVVCDKIIVWQPPVPIVGDNNYPRYRGLSGLYLSSIEGRFPEDRYYKHICSLVRILYLCLQFKISEEENQRKIELGI